jgi:branched-chain amino acid transport system permease protein
MKRWLFPLAVVTGLGLLQWIATMLLLEGPILQGPYYYQILLLAGINVILAVSLNLTNGVAGQFSIGHAGFFAVGAYTAACVSVYGGAPLSGMFPDVPFVRETVVLILATATGALAAAAAGWLVGMPSLRLRGDYLAIVTLGFGEIIRVLILNIDVVGGARGFTGIPRLSNIFWVGLGVAGALAVVHNMTRSSHGRALLAIRGDEIAAQAAGINVTRLKVTAFVISAAFAGVAGSLFAHFTMFVHPNTFTFMKSFEIIIMIALGGLGSLAGAVLGAVVLTVLPELFRGFAEYRMVIYALALILIMIYRPQGLLGLRGLKGLHGLGGFLGRARRRTWGHKKDPGEKDDKGDAA